MTFRLDEHNQHVQREESQRREQCQIFVVIVVRISHRVTAAIPVTGVFLVEAVSAWHLHGPYSDCAWHTPFSGLRQDIAGYGVGRVQDVDTLGFCDARPLFIEKVFDYREGFRSRSGGRPLVVQIAAHLI